MTSTPVAIPKQVITDIIGPVALSVCFNAFLYGFAFVQFWHYQASEGTDNLLNRLASFCRKRMWISIGWQEHQKMSRRMGGPGGYDAHRFNNVHVMVLHCCQFHQPCSGWEYSLAINGSANLYRSVRTIGIPSWCYRAHLWCSLSASFPTQIYFAWRVQQFSKSWLYFWVIVIMSLISSGFGIAGGIFAFTETR